eukprot:scaffold1307_cov200-Pinguiococcus_pyrenoidosus.AAC.154
MVGVLPWIAYMGKCEGCPGRSGCAEMQKKTTPTTLANLQIRRVTNALSRHPCILHRCTMGLSLFRRSCHPHIAAALRLVFQEVSQGFEKLAWASCFPPLLDKG